MGQLKMYFLLKMGIFNCQVSLPEGKSWMDHRSSINVWRGQIIQGNYQKSSPEIFWEKKLCHSSRQQAFLKRHIIYIYIYMYTSIWVDLFWCGSLMQLPKGSSFDSNHDEPRWWRWRRRWSWYRLWSIWSPSWICMWTRTWAIMNTGLWNIVNMNNETYCW